MKVLHVITGLDAGGAEQQLLALLRHRTVAAEVATLSNPGIVATALRADDVPVHHIAMAGNTDLRAVGRLASLIRRGRFDVVHTHLYRACVFGRVAARLAGVRSVVATEHSLGSALIEGRPVGRPGVRGLYRATERLGRTTIAVSPDVVERLRQWGVPPSRITLLRNGIDLERHAFDPVERARVRADLGIPPDRPVVGAVGRLDPTKRFDVLIDALPRLPGTTALVVGRGPQRKELEARARVAGVGDRVVFVGESAEVPALMSAMDVLASPSPAETFGLALLEAAAAGLPIAYVAGPVLDELADGERHLRIAPLPDEFAAALVTLLARHLDRRPPPGIGRHDIREIATELDGVYRRITDTHHSSHTGRSSR
ncbi:glycosyltransferase [Pseudonocardia sp. NPDC049635]|uniref:glycosyltransferase n=1 Tax=Pseudonocardia sp. NPDC049635 TaxID=3155506 RepID=UPI00340AC810